MDLILTDDYACGLTPSVSDAEARELAEYVRDCGIGILALTPYVHGLDAPEAAERTAAVEELKRCVELAALLGCRSVRVWAGSREWPDAERSDAVRRVADSLRAVEGHCDSAGCSLNIENHARTLATSSEGVVEIVEATGSDAVGVLYDPANLSLLGEGDYEAVFDRLAPHIRHVHIKDMKIFRRRARTYLPVLMGEGDVPWPLLLGRLRETGYDGCLSVEYEKRWHGDAIPDSALALRHEIAAIRGMLEELATGRGAAAPPRSGAHR
jgi:sugar phosphate isomerase/epimerase